MVYRVSTNISKEKFESMISGGKSYVPVAVSRAIKDAKKGDLLNKKSLSKDEAFDAIKYLVEQKLIKTSKTPFKIVRTAAREQWKDEQKAKAEEEAGILPDRISKRFSTSNTDLAQKIKNESRLVHQRLQRVEETPDDDKRISATKLSFKKLEEHAKKAEKEAKVLRQQLRNRGIKNPEHERWAKELLASAKEARKQAKAHEKKLAQALEDLEVKKGHIRANIMIDVTEQQDKEDILIDRSGERRSILGRNVIDDIKKKQEKRDNKIDEETNKREQQSGDDIKKKKGPELVDTKNLPDMDIG